MIGKRISVISGQGYFSLNLGENEKLKNVILELKKQNEEQVEVIHLILIFKRSPVKGRGGIFF